MAQEPTEELFGSTMGTSLPSETAQRLAMPVAESGGRRCLLRLGDVAKWILPDDFASGAPRVPLRDFVLVPKDEHIRREAGTLQSTPHTAAAYWTHPIALE